ncbi:MAG: hypothetical protein WAQ98_22210 [Blastocatellia bacterium]
MNQVSIYRVLNAYHLVLEQISTKEGKKSYLIKTAESPEKLYSTAFDLVAKENKKGKLVDPLDYIKEKTNRVQQEEELALRVGRSYLRKGNQQRATDFFKRANLLYQQRVSLEKEFLAFKGLNISQVEFVKPIEL